jgi:hypothetical protein
MRLLAGIGTLTLMLEKKIMGVINQNLFKDVCVGFRQTFGI